MNGKMNATTPYPLYTPEGAVVLLQGVFRKKASRLCRDNFSLIDDVVQEMTLGVLMCKGAHTLAFFGSRGADRGINFMRAEARQSLRRVKFSQLAQRISQEDDTPFIEGLIDFQDSMTERPEATDIVQMPDDWRATG
jgi:hypothetical protein